MTNSRLTDPEVLEWRFPVRLESFRIRRGSGGVGKHPRSVTDSHQQIAGMVLRGSEHVRRLPEAFLVILTDYAKNRNAVL